MVAEYLWGFCTGGFEKIFEPSLGGGERSEQGVVLPLPVENEPSHPCVTDLTETIISLMV